MAATLIAVIVALVLGHVAQSLAASVRHFAWYGNWLRWLDSRFSEGSFWRGRYGIVLALLPPLVGLVLFQLALDEPLLGLAGLLLGVVVLFYAWGPRDLDLDVDAIVEARDPIARREAAAKLWPEGAKVDSLDGASLVDATSLVDAASLVAAVFRNALRRWFGVLFWFLLLGPVGALLYRLAALSAEGEYARALPAETAGGARALLALLDWPVAQLMTLSMALVGNFDTVVGAWREAGGTSFRLDADFLGAAARASVKSELADEAMDYAESSDVNTTGVMASAPELPELRDAMSLVWRILLLWLAVIALFVIAGWVA